jgi:hypothetical protein
MGAAVHEEERSHPPSRTNIILKKNNNNKIIKIKKKNKNKKNNNNNNVRLFLHRVSRPGVPKDVCTRFVDLESLRVFFLSGCHNLG